MRLTELRQRRDELLSQRQALLDEVLADDREDLTPEEDAAFRSASAAIEQLGERIERALRRGEGNPGAEAVARAHARGGTDSRGGGWADRAAKAVRSIGGENRSVVSGSIDLPALVEADVAPMPRPQRLIDLIVSRKAITSPAFEYLRQSLRQSNAAPVADLAAKPVSTFTTEPITDTVRVVAHLSEGVPVRYWDDHREIVNWLESEMVAGLLDALEAQIVAGDGEGINMEGLLTVAGTTAVAYSGDLPSTLRSAITALQVLGVQPNAWVLNPADAQAVDLLRWSWDPAAASPAQFLADGFTNSAANSANIFGGSDIQRVVSNSIPAGTAVLGAWDKLRLYIRQGTTLDVDTFGDNFSHNTATLRAEGRFGVGHLMPSSFAIVDLAP